MSNAEEQINPISQQFSNLQIDKLIICKKELLYLQEIISFYMANSTDFYTSKFKEIAQNITQLIDITIPSLYTKITDTFNNYSEKPYYYLTYYEQTETKINDLVEKMKLLSMKVSQNTEEYFDQYLPKAPMGRRYNNKAITHFFENYFQNILKKYNPSTDKTSPIVVWDFSNNYTVNHGTHRDEHAIVKNAFWYYEIPRLIPNLVHEIGHLLEDSKNYREIQNFIELPEKEMDIFEEIYGDIVAYKELGYSYLFSLFYTIGYNNFSHIFHNSKHESITIPLFKQADAYPENEMIILRSFIKNYARISLLIDLALNQAEREEKNSLIKHIDSVRTFISVYLVLDFDSEDNPQSDNILSQIYKDYYPEHYEEYINICRQIKAIKESILSSIEKIDNKLENNSTNISSLFSYNVQKDKDYETIFNEKWQKRIENSNIWYHKNDLRKDILKHILYSPNNSYEAYELILYKNRFDSENTENTENTENSSIFIENNNFNKTNKIFGLFDRLSLIKKTEEIEYKNFKNFLSRNNHNNENRIQKSYCIKYPLTLIDQKNKDSGLNLPYGLILQIQLKDLEESSIIEGYNILKNSDFSKKANNQQYTIYKSLGPNDYIVSFPSLTLDAIFEIKQYLSQKSSIRRTSSLIYFNEKNNSKKPCETKNTSYFVYSKLRLKSSTELLKNVVNHISYQKLLYTPGTTDATIIWKSDTSENDIFNNIEQLKNLLVISDIQTFIEQIMNSTSDIRE